LAGDYYEMSGKAESSVRKCKEQRALILSEDEDQLEAAADIFQEVAEQCMTKNITKFHAKGWFQKCVLCHLAMGDSVGASEAAENASMQDPRFPQGREGAFVLKIVELCKERSDLKEFQSTLSKYNAITALDNWEADILIKIKRKYFPEGDAALADDLAGDVDAGDDDEGGDDDDLL
jgi:alpha-soluble NSF attachment protein